MTSEVNPDVAERRARRVALTEQRLVEAATRLFLRRGYAGTTLAAVAEEAGVAARTVYVRFSTKAALFRRVMDVAVVGDVAPVDLASRGWVQRALTAPTLAERMGVLAGNTRVLMSRVGPLLPVYEQAAGTEPELREAAQAARMGTAALIRQFWGAAAQDGLLPAGVDLDWLADTCGILTGADTYLHIRRVLDWTPEQYERWLVTTWTRLLAHGAMPS